MCKWQTRACYSLKLITWIWTWFRLPITEESHLELTLHFNKKTLNYMKKNISLNKLMIIGAILVASSCNKDFLKETLTNARNTDFYKTDAGIQQLAVGTYYQVFSVPENGEWYYAATNYGTDEFHVGGDPSNSPWNNYDPTYNSVITTSTTGNLAGANLQW